MSKIIPFLFETEHLVRVVRIDGEPWFVLADVCRVLEIGNSRDAAARLDSDEKKKIDMGVGNIDGAKFNSLGAGAGNNETWIINESGLYALIFTSRKPAAKRFRKWVTGEVLPNLRRSGQYTMPGALPPEPELAAADPALSDLPVNEARAWLDGIALALRVHGRAAAKAMWARSPLPQVGSGPVTDEDGAMDKAATEARACLDHLLGLEIESRLLADWLAAPEAEGQRAILRHGGILPDPPGWTGYFAVARHSKPLARHFAATEWARGGWGDALAHLPGARRGPAPLRIHPGENTRVVLIPYRLVREADATA